MESCDVLIVGGGPAGSTCARRLRAAGLDVMVFDKQKFPRDKTCAGWITPAVIEELELDTGEYARSRVFQPITGFRTGMLGRAAVETHYPKPVSYGIRRCEFDHYLLERCSARLRLGETIRSIERAAGGWVVNDSITAAMLVGAGGHFCPVARLLGAAGGGKELVVAAQEIEFRMTEQQARDCKVQAAVPELYFCPDLKGYAWCFRKGEYLNVGLGREDSRRLSEHVRDFAALMKQEGRIPHDTPERFHGHAYILYGHTARALIDDAVLLIGDAAGLAYVASGEGIRPAVESGLMAARVLLDAGRDYRRDRLTPYVEGITQRFGRRSPAGAVSTLFPERVKEWVAARLLEARWFSRHVLIDRWFLHSQQAPLVWG